MPAAGAFAEIWNTATSWNELMGAHLDFLNGKLAGAHVSGYQGGQLDRGQAGSFVRLLSEASRAFDMITLDSQPSECEPFRGGTNVQRGYIEGVVRTAAAAKRMRDAALSVPGLSFAQERGGFMHVTGDVNVTTLEWPEKRVFVPLTVSVYEDPRHVKFETRLFLNLEVEPVSFLLQTDSLIDRRLREALEERAQQVYIVGDAFCDPQFEARVRAAMHALRRK